jgi:hypothetical protein
MSQLLSGVPDFGTDFVNVETYAESTQFRCGFNDPDQSFSTTTVRNDNKEASMESQPCSLSVYTYAPYWSIHILSPA